MSVKVILNEGSEYQQGKDTFKPGDEIELDDNKVDVLVDAGIVRLVEDEPVKKLKSKKK